MNFHYVYKITNLKTGKYYIGKHSTSDIDDNYFGSGNLILKAFKKHGKESFKKEILKFCETERGALKLEAELVTIEVVKDPMCYNMALGGTGGIHTDDTKMILSKKLTGNKNALTSPVSMYNKDDVFLQSFDSCADAGEFVGKGRIKGSIVIARCARGIKPTAYGYKWKYK